MRAGLKNTYVEMNDVETYFAYIKTLAGMVMLIWQKKISFIWFR